MFIDKVILHYLEVIMREGDDSLFFNLIKRDWAFPAFVFSLIGLFGSVFIDIPYPLILAFGLILFTAFDVFGYGSVEQSTDRENLVRYRIIQTGFQWTLFLLLGIITHWNTWVTIGYIYLWWMGVCDMLFYVLLGKLGDMLNYGNMYWLWWTPIGIWNKLNGRETGGKEVLYITVYSAILWYAIWVLFPNIQRLRLF
jgi:hypothetical protein